MVKTRPSTYEQSVISFDKYASSKRKNKRFRDFIHLSPVERRELQTLYENVSSSLKLVDNTSIAGGKIHTLYLVVISSFRYIEFVTRKKLTHSKYRHFRDIFLDRMYDFLGGDCGIELLPKNEQKLLKIMCNEYIQNIANLS